MEAVPRLPMISFDLKVSPDRPATEFSKLKPYIRDFYNEDPETYSNEIRNLEALRAQAVHPSKDVNGCSVLKKYYCQLHFLQSRFPMNKDGAAAIAFTWRDTYSSMVCSVLDVKYEIVAILYNIGALHSQMGASDDRTTPEGLKMACSHFQCAAWAFQHIKDTYPQPSGMDLSPDLMQFMYQLCLAQAQECILEKSMTDNRKATINAKVATQIVDYYNLAHSALVQSGSDDGAIVDIVGSKLLKNWKRYVRFKATYYGCVSLLYQGLQSEEQQKMGERVTYYQGALDKHNDAVKMSKGLDHPEAIQESLMFTRDVIEEKRKAAKCENEFIYHEEVPDLESLPPCKGATLVKGISFNINDPEISGPDIFSRLVPMKAHEASSLYSEEKAKLLRKMSNLIDTKDEEVVSFMSCLQLDQLRAHLEQDMLPQEVVDRCAALSAKPDAIPNLIAAMDKLNDAYHDVDGMLQEIMELIKIEDKCEKEYQDMMGRRGPSIVATDLTREANKYMEAHKKAADSNETLNRAMSQHVENLRVLQQPLTQLQAQLPTLAPLNLGENEILKEVAMLVKKVEEMRKQRAMLASQLRESICSDDITTLLVTRSAENIDNIFQEELQKHDRYVKLIEQNLAAQENILKALTDAYANYAPTRKATLEIMRQRDLMLSALVSSYDAYEDLLAKSSKGLEFYRKLETNLTKLLQRVKGTCKVQQEEREAILAKNNLKIGAVDPGNVGEVAPPAPKLKDYLQKRKETGSFGYNAGYPNQVDVGQAWLPGVRPPSVDAELPQAHASSALKAEHMAQPPVAGYPQPYQAQVFPSYQVPYNQNILQYPSQATPLQNLQYPSLADPSTAAEPTAPYRPESCSTDTSDQGIPQLATSQASLTYPPSVPSPNQDPKVKSSPSHEQNLPSAPQFQLKPEGAQTAQTNKVLQPPQYPQGPYYPAQSQGQPYYNYGSQYTGYPVAASHEEYISKVTATGGVYNGVYTVTSPYTNYYISQMYNGNVSSTATAKPASQLSSTYTPPVGQPTSTVYHAASNVSQPASSYTANTTPNQVPSCTHTVPSTPYTNNSTYSQPAASVNYSAASHYAAAPQVNSSSKEQVPPTVQVTQQLSYPDQRLAYPPTLNQSTAYPSHATPYNITTPNATNQPSSNILTAENYPSIMPQQSGFPPTGQETTYSAGQIYQTSFSPNYAVTSAGISTYTDKLSSCYAGQLAYSAQMYNPNQTAYALGSTTNYVNQGQHSTGNYSVPPQQSTYHRSDTSPNYSNQQSAGGYSTNPNLPSVENHIGSHLPTNYAVSGSNHVSPAAVYSSDKLQNYSNSLPPTVGYGTTALPTGYVPASTDVNRVQNVYPVPYQYSESTPKPEACSEETSGRASTEQEARSNVDLLAGLDFSLSVAPLQPSPSQVTESLDNLSISTTPQPLLNGKSPSQIEEVNQKKIEDKNSINSVGVGNEEIVVKPVKDPFSEPDVLNSFVQEVEKFEKFVDGLCQKTLSGPTPLDIKWNELQDLQEKDSHKQNISVARCYPMKNRYPDILPYDNSRVELPSTKDDYINASFIKNLHPGCPNFIMTQSPLTSTFCDFWTMIIEQHVELIVCLLSDSQLDGETYWPANKTDELVFGQIKISLQSCNLRSHWVERIISVSNVKTSRVVVHLQFTAWPNSWFPESPGPLLALVSESYTIWRGSRCAESCVVVHCDAGVGRSGLFVLTSLSIAELSQLGHLPDLLQLAANLANYRKNPLRGRDHLKFAYQILLYFCQDLLMKRGILSSKVSFDEKRGKTKSHTRHPSQDFLQSSTQSLSCEERRHSDSSSTGSVKHTEADPLNQLDPLWSIKRHS